MIAIEKTWLERLAVIAERAKKDQDQWFKGTKELMPESISMLIGYASSAETLLKYCEEIKKWN